KTPMPPVPVKGPGGVDLILPRGTVTATPLGEFGAVIITANNQADLELVRQILRQLEEYLRREAAAGPKLEVIELQYADAVEMVNLLNQLSARATYGPAAQRQQPGGGGFPFGGAVGQPQAQQLGGGGSVFLLPLARRNAALMFGPDLRFPYYRELIKQLDTKNTNLPIPIKLKKASAQLVANQLTQFYNQRYNAAGETSANNLTRFTYDTSSNTIFVQAGRGDLEETQSLIDRIDSEVPLAINELRIIRLHNSPADDLANTLQVALLQNILPQGTGVVQAAAAAGPGGAFGAPLGGAPLGAA